MSVQFGRWNFEGQPPAPNYIDKVSATLAPYGPDSNESYAMGGIKIIYRAFHTTKESHHETQPHISASGAVITWDGRLDNGVELISELRDYVGRNHTDVAIVAAAYERWGVDSLAKLIGDWALSIWNPPDRSLLLARDPVGTRHLYYSFDKDQITWSTILDPLARFAGNTFAICEKYIAGWLSVVLPAAHLTPYLGIYPVPSSCSVLIRPGRHRVGKYWDFDRAKKIRYRKDAEYEEHFRTVFGQAVQRRLRSDRPVLAELSGGMDSSSIVCMADTIIARGAAETPRLDTISWYNDFDPDVNERPYFTKVEEKRGRTGWHIDLHTLRQKEVSLPNSFMSDCGSDCFAATPTSNSPLPEIFQQYVAHMMAQGHRVTLSGIGGEQATGGGVPTPTPELQNLIARGHFFTLAHQLTAWAAKMRKPRLPLAWEAVRGFLFRSPALVPESKQPLPWFAHGFVRRNRSAFCGYRSRVKLFGALPSFQTHIHELDHMHRFLAYCGLHPDRHRETRYPYLDRDVLDFAYAVPREQLVRVGQRRSLMKRALQGIVPDELLNRTRKAAVSRQTKKDTFTEWPTPHEMREHMVSSSVGIIDLMRFSKALQKARQGEEVSIEGLMLTLKLEAWLRHLMIQGVLMRSVTTEPGCPGSLTCQGVQGSAQYKEFS